MVESAKPETPGGTERGATSTATEDVQALRLRAETAERERADYLDLLQRTRAEFENYQKRIQRDLREERRYAPAAMLQELFPVLDNLERALEAARAKGQPDPLLEGVALVQSQLLDVF